MMIIMLHAIFEWGVVCLTVQRSSVGDDHYAACHLRMGCVCVSLYRAGP